MFLRASGNDLSNIQKVGALFIVFIRHKGLLEIVIGNISKYILRSQKIIKFINCMSEIFIKLQQIKYLIY